MSSDNNNNKSLFAKAFHFYIHDKPTDFNPTDNEYYYAFLQSFTFWKFFLLFVLALIIGIINLINKKPVDEEMKNNTGKWLLEWFLLVLAFFVPCLIMYVLRDWNNENFTLLTLIKTFIIICFLCMIKHLDFQLSGLYRWKFSSKKCLKYKEHFKENKEESNKEKEKEEETKCKCDDSNFDGPLWDGLGWFGFVFFIILSLFFLLFIKYPNLLIKLFGINLNYKIFSIILDNRKFSGICLLLIMSIFTTGFFLIKTFKNKDCSNNDTFNSIRDGGACVTVVFTTVITFLPLIILFLWPRSKNNDFISKLLYKNKKEFRGMRRHFIVICEIIVTWLIFSLVEAGIESIRKEEDLSHILNNKDFWFSSSSLMTFLGIAYIQIILEYSGWFYMHLFKPQKNKNS